MNSAGGGKSGLFEAVSLLEDILRDPKWTREWALPSLRVLSKWSGFSNYSLWKAVKILEQRGVLVVSQGRRTRLAGAGIAEKGGDPLGLMDGPRPSLSKWEELAESLAKEIIRGRYRPGEILPSLKELRNPYRVSHFTLKKAINSLVDRQVLVRNLKSYQVRPLAEPPPASALVYLAWGDDAGNFHPGTPFDHEILCVLEEECSRRRIRLEKVAYRHRGDTLVFFKAGRMHRSLPESSRDALGILVRTACGRDAAPAIIPLLAALRKPVLALDGMGSPGLDDLSGKIPDLQVFDPALCDAPATEMGQYLFDLGHRKVAFLSPWHGAIGSRRRLEGLRKVFDSSGDPPGYGRGLEVVPVTLELPSPSLTGPDEGTSVSGLMARGLETAERHWKPDYPPLPELIKGLEPHMRRIAWRGTALAGMTPLLDEALRRKDITAWVGVDDEAALMALEYLRLRGMTAPGHISLAGCGNTAEGSRSGLTSYAFNFGGRIQAWLNSILGASGSRPPRAGKPLDLEGKVMPRETVGKGPFFRKREALQEGA